MKNKGKNYIYQLFYASFDSRFTGIMRRYPLPPQSLLRFFELVAEVAIVSSIQFPTGFQRIQTVIQQL